MKSFKTLTKSIFIFSLLSPLSVNASDNWYVSTTVNGMTGNYAGSEQRNDLLSASFILKADYLDSFSFAVAYNNFNINFKDAGAGPFEINQDAFAGQLQYHFYSDTFSGKITTQIVAHSISNNDASGLSDDVSVYAPKLAYTSLDNDLYLDIEYVNSSYPNNGDLTITQLSPSVGFAFNQQSDWLRLKLFLIESSDKNLSQGEDSLSSVAIKWSHWLSPGAALGINSFFIDVLAGKRIYAVDNDAFSVYNLADIQQGSLLFGLNWKAGGDIDISAIAGVEKYENKSISNDYNQQYIYLSLTKHW